MYPVYSLEDLRAIERQAEIESAKRLGLPLPPEALAADAPASPEPIQEDSPVKEGAI